METRKRAIGVLKKYGWVLVCLVLMGWFTDIPFFKYTLGLAALPFACLIFLPLLKRLLRPSYHFEIMLIRHYRRHRGLSFAKKYFFIPMTMIAGIAFAVAQCLLCVWILAVSFKTWSSVLGVFWTGILTFYSGLAPVMILLAPVLRGFREGMMPLLVTAVLILTAYFWFRFSKYAFPGRPASPPKAIVGYSPAVFLAGALSFQVIALPFYPLRLPAVGNMISVFSGFIFLLFAAMAAVKWRSAEKNLSKEQKKDLYISPILPCILGVLIAGILDYALLSFGASRIVILCLQAIFVVAAIERLLEFLRLRSSSKISALS